MNRRALRILALAVLLVLAAGMLPAMAASKPKIVTRTLWLGCDRMAYPGEIYYVHIDHLPKKAKIIACRSSDESVLQFDDHPFFFEPEDYITTIELHPVKAGKARLTVTYRLGRKDYDISAVYTVKKHPKPVKSLTLNGKKLDVMKSWNGYQYDYDPKNNGDIYRLNLTPRSGWRIARVWLIFDDGKTRFRNDKPFTFTWDEGAPVSTARVKYELKNAKGEVFYYSFCMTVLN